MKPKTVRIMTNAQASAAAVVRPDIRSGSSRFNSIEERKKHSTRKIVVHDESRSTIMYSSENNNSEYEVDSDLGEELPAYLICISPCKYKKSILNSAVQNDEDKDEVNFTSRLSKQPEKSLIYYQLNDSLNLNSQVRTEQQINR